MSCWRQLQRCVTTSGCTEGERVRPTVEILSALILRDCPVENSGPCPVIGCEECPICEELPVLECPEPPQPLTQPTTITVTTVSSATTAPCKVCDCQPEELKACQDSLTFVQLSKDGAQSTRVSWREEAERLGRLYEREQNTSASYRQKWESVLKLYQECQIGYLAANDSLDFSVNLVNEHSKIASDLNDTLLECKNQTVLVEVQLDKCRNGSAEDALTKGYQASNLTAVRKRLHQCKTTLEKTESSLNSNEQRLAGKYLLNFTMERWTSTYKLLEC
jgi:hypothetical protein